MDSIEKPPAGQIARLAEWYSSEVELLNQTIADILDSKDEFDSIDQSVIEIFSFLDFDGKEDWRRFVEQQKLPPMLKIDRSGFAKIKDAYSNKNNLDTLLEQHQLIILAEGPSFARHSILLRLAQLEKNKWQEELKAFEKHRFLELEKQLNQAEAEFDKSLMDQTIHEIRMVQWTLPLPENLVAAAKEKEATNYADQVEYQLGQLAKQMLVHFEAREWKKANKLKKEWKRLYALTENDAKEKMSQELGNILDWADEQDGQSNSNRNTSKMIAICASAVLVLAMTIGLLILFN